MDSEELQMKQADEAINQMKKRRKVDSHEFVSAYGVCMCVGTSVF
jgi:hypothetical protein